MEKLTEFINTIYQSIATGMGDWGLKLIGAIGALIFGLLFIRLFMKGLSKIFDLKLVDDTLKSFLLTLMGFLLKLILLLSIAGIVGFPVATFAALMAGVGVALGAAFNGSLGHLASGVILLIFRPFKVGDLIEVNGELGFVKEVSVFVTILNTFQNKTSIIPNGNITSNKILNYSTVGNLRVDMPFGIRYGADIEKAKEIVLNVLINDPNVLSNPAPRIVVNNLGENGIELLALPYSNCETYWDVYWDTRQKLLEALAGAGFEAPLPQRIITNK